MAQFIGRNTILDGTLRDLVDGQGIVATRFGDLAGQPSAEVAAGRAAKIVIPSEAFDVFPAADHGRDSLQGSYGQNVLPGVVERREVLGQCCADDGAA